MAYGASRGAACASLARLRSPSAPSGPQLTVRGGVALCATIAVLSAAFSLLTIHNAYHPSDDGFVLSLAWRVWNGEVPYRDFVYVRTPLTLYMYAPLFALPEGSQIQTGRVLFYVAMAIATLAPAVWAAATGKLTLDVRSIVFIGIFYVLSVHTFPPQPWYTVDALLFSSLALAAFLHSIGPGTRSRSRVVAAVCLVLAGLAKQNFFALSLLLAAFALVEHQRARDTRRLLASILPGALLVGAFVALVSMSGGLAAMREQLAAASTLELFQPVLASTFDLAYMPELALIVTVAFLAARRGWRVPVGGAAMALAVLAPLEGMAATPGTDQNVAFFIAGRDVFFWLAATEVGLLMRGHSLDRTAIGAAGALAIALCSALSVGYPSPILALGVLAPFAYLRLRLDLDLHGAIGVLALAVATITVFGATLESPYRDRPRGQQVADLGQVFPRFGVLYTNAANASRFAELKQIVSSIGPDDPFVVMRGYALVYFLSGHRNAIGADAFYAELEYRGQEARLRAEIARKRPTIVIERVPIEMVGDAPGRDDCATALRRAPVAAGIAGSGWSLSRVGDSFCVYSPE